MLLFSRQDKILYILDTTILIFYRKLYINIVSIIVLDIETRQCNNKINLANINEKLLKKKLELKSVDSSSSSRRYGIFFIVVARCIFFSVAPRWHDVPLSRRYSLRVRKTKSRHLTTL